MEMRTDNQVASRRISLIAGHFSSAGDVSASHVVPVKCSASMISVFKRHDGKAYFARQGSDSQPFFMKQASTEQGSSAQPTAPPKFSTANQGSLIAIEAPMFSRPARMECFELPATDTPKFSRPSPRCETKQPHPRTEFQDSASNGRSTRMDVAESGCKFFLSVELPDVKIKDIRVEVKDQHMTILGKRSAPWWRVTSFINGPISTYQKREILQEQYHVMWLLPAGVNKDSVTAEFMDGILQITIPKL